MTDQRSYWRMGATAFWLVAAVLPSAQAWSGHALLTWQAFGDAHEVAAHRVHAESLERFVTARGPQLERLLAEHEAWARANLPDYPARPDHLAFRAEPHDAAHAPPARDRFLMALRVNPFSHVPLFLQARPEDSRADLPLLGWQAVTTLASGIGARESRFLRLAEGESVSALDVLATASAEPDYGLDLGLYSDSGTPFGLRYGFGRQPFGDPAVEYGSQAPFHMGFHHEARIVFLAASFLRNTQPEARIALFSALARDAFATGHGYWGWRFSGWALHYVQDLTQPYHASVLPGVSTLRMIGLNLLGMVGYQRPKLDAITLVSNRHVALENYQLARMQRIHREARWDDAMVKALRDTKGDGRHWRYEGTSTRAIVTSEAQAAADALDAQLERSLPQRYTSDPGISLGNEADLLDMDRIARQHSPEENLHLEEHVVRLMANLGRHTRALMRSLLQSLVNAPGVPGTPPRPGQ